jgi:hypothetical protein
MRALFALLRKDLTQIEGLSPHLSLKLMCIGWWTGLQSAASTRSSWNRMTRNAAFPAARVGSPPVGALVFGTSRGLEAHVVGTRRPRQYRPLSHRQKGEMNGRGCSRNHRQEAALLSCVFQGETMQQREKSDDRYDAAIRAKLGEGFRARHNLMPAGHELSCPRHHGYAEVDECVAAMVRANNRKSCGPEEA